MRSVELFAGAGGLAIAMSNAGFRHAAVVERNHDACETFRENQRLHLHAVNEWPLYEGDVRDFDYRGVSNVMVVSGGRRAGRFRSAENTAATLNKRDMFPEAVRAVHELRPKAFLFENVKGLMRETFASYFEYLLLRFAHPSVTRRSCESPRDHCARLERHHTPEGRAPSTTLCSVCLTRRTSVSHSVGNECSSLDSAPISAFSGVFRKGTTRRTPCSSARLVACPPQDGVTRAREPNGVDGVRS